MQSAKETNTAAHTGPEKRSMPGRRPAPAPEDVPPTPSIAGVGLSAPPPSMWTVDLPMRRGGAAAAMCEIGRAHD